MPTITTVHESHCLRWRQTTYLTYALVFLPGEVRLTLDISLAGKFRVVCGTQVLYTGYRFAQAKAAFEQAQTLKEVACATPPTHSVRPGRT